MSEKEVQVIGLSEKEVQEIGARINVVLVMAGRKQSLSDQIKEQEIRIHGNNSRVAKLQKEVDADNALAQGVIVSLSKELDEVSSALAIALAVLEKEGYKLPIGGKASKSVSM